MAQRPTYLRLGTFELVADEDGILLGEPFVGIARPGDRIRSVSSAGDNYVLPLAQTFHEFLLNYLSWNLGVAWLEAERQKSVDRHPIATWFMDYEQVREFAAKDPATGRYAAEMNGSARALLTLAWDLYTVQHCSGRIPVKMMNRLKHPDQFQSAAYELAVGGIALRAGFRFKEWLRDTDKHVEFIAKHRRTGVEVAFEAKSHYRGGVLGYPGKFDPEKSSVKVLNQLDTAAAQAPKGMPLIVFSDINLPVSPDDDQETSWFKSFDEQIRNHGAKCKAMEPGSPFAGAVLTNYAWHYFGDKTGTPRGREVGQLWSPNGSQVLDRRLYEDLLLSAGQYGLVPRRSDEWR